MPRLLHTWRWTMLAAVLGYASSAVFADWLAWGRPGFVAAHSVVVLGLLAAYIHMEGVELAPQFRRRMVSGFLGGVIMGLLLIRQVQTQPPSGRPAGMGLVAALLGYGLWYGFIDAMLLTVLPVLTVYGAQPPGALTSQAARLRYGGLALLASVVVTAAYHLGFPEYRGATLLAPLIGNALVTLAYLLTGSPMAAVVAHVLMHGAAVMHGMSTAVQLPPHA